MVCASGSVLFSFVLFTSTLTPRSESTRALSLDLNSESCAFQLHSERWLVTHGVPLPSVGLRLTTTVVVIQPRMARNSVAVVRAMNTSLRAHFGLYKGSNTIVKSGVSRSKGYHRSGIQSGTDQLPLTLVGRCICSRQNELQKRR